PRSVRDAAQRASAAGPHRRTTGRHRRVDSARRLRLLDRLSGGAGGTRARRLPRAHRSQVAPSARARHHAGGHPSARTDLGAHPRASRLRDPVPIDLLGASVTMEIRPFATEQYFGQYEHVVAHTLSASDAESMTVGELCAAAGLAAEEIASIPLGYPE